MEAGGVLLSALEARNDTQGKQPGTSSGENFQVGKPYASHNWHRPGVDRVAVQGEISLNGFCAFSVCLLS
jgi:hypothetical protein